MNLVSKYGKMNNLGFRVMSLFLRRMKSASMINHLLRASGINSGQNILDYACGPGLFTIAAAKMVSPSGHVYASDMQPLAKKYIYKGARKANLTNITVFITSGKLNIPDEEIDIALLFDVIHDLQNREKVFKELHRVLKDGGCLAVDVHHVAADTVIQTVEASHLFQLEREEDLHEKHSNRLLVFSKSSPLA